MKTLIEKLQGERILPPIDTEAQEGVNFGLAMAIRIVMNHTCKYTWTGSFWVAECGYDAEDHYYHCAKCGGKIEEVPECL